MYIRIFFQCIHHYSNYHVIISSGAAVRRSLETSDFQCKVLSGRKLVLLVVKREEPSTFLYNMFLFLNRDYL